MGLRVLRDAIDSTQSHALRAAREGADPGTRIVARTQSRGLGRLDHRWASPHGGLYLSEIRADPRPGAGLLPIALGVELRQTFASRYHVHALLRWPNDLLIVGARKPRKLAGVLCDAIFAPWGPAVVIGVGLNVAARPLDFPAALRSKVVGLAELVQPPPELDALEADVVAAIDRACAAVVTEPGRRRILRLAREALYGLGRRARVDGQVAGRIQDVNEDGSLRLGLGGDGVDIHAGTLVVEEAE